MPTTTSSTSPISSVTATITFLSREMKEAPYYRRNPEPGQPSTNVVSDGVPTEIIDLSSLPVEERDTFTVDTSGFQILRHESAFDFEGFEDDARIRTEYFPEVERVLKDVTGASHIILFDYTLRRRKHNAPEDFNPKNRGPGLKAHVDQTAKSGRDNFLEHAGKDAERLSKGRVQIINLWRPLNVVQDTPLAYCDYRTLDAEHDLVPSVMIGGPGGKGGETYSIHANPDQKWYFFKNQTPSDVVLLKCYESEPREGRAMVTPHSAFVDPTVPDTVPARQSIEVRALVCYADEETSIKGKCP